MSGKSSGSQPRPGRRASFPEHLPDPGPAAAVAVAARRTVGGAGIAARAGGWVAAARGVALVAGVTDDRVRAVAGTGLAGVGLGAGIAVIAHPARYGFTANEEFALFSEFKSHGGRGVEVVTGSHTAAEYLTYADTAREFGLAASRGSDFHSPDESHTELGTLPYLPGNLTPVWELLSERIQHSTDPSPEAQASSGF